MSLFGYVVQNLVYLINALWFHQLQVFSKLIRQQFYHVYKYISGQWEYFFFNRTLFPPGWIYAVWMSSRCVGGQNWVLLGGASIYPDQQSTWSDAFLTGVLNIFMQMIFLMISRPSTRWTAIWLMSPARIQEQPGYSMKLKPHMWKAKHVPPPKENTSRSKCINN